MKLKSCLSFKPKLSKPNCPNIFSIFAIKPNHKRRFRLKRPRFKLKRRRFKAKFRKRFSVKALSFPKCHSKPNLKFNRPRRKTRPNKKNPVPVPDVDRFGEKVSELVSVFRSSRRSQELDRVMDIKNLDLGDDEKNHHKYQHQHQHEQPNNLSTSDGDDVDGDKSDVCRSFENYVAEMIVEEGKLKDLADVEEMLYCWKSLKSQVFVDLVCRFYGEMCEDLFSEEEEEEKNTPSTSTDTTTTTTTTTTASE